MYIRRSEDVKMSRTSSERLMYVQFISYVKGVRIIYPPFIKSVWKISSVDTINKSIIDRHFHLYVSSINKTNHTTVNITSLFSSSIYFNL